MERTLGPTELARIPSADEKLVLARQQVGSIFCFMGAPLLEDADLISVAADWADGARVIAAQPDVPRNLTALLVDANASILTGTLTITGVDAQGRPVVEVMTVAAGVGLAFTGTKIFARVDTAVITDTTGVVNAGADQLVIGVGSVIGLPVDIERAAEVMFAYLGGTLTTPDAVATGVSTSGVNLTSGTYDGTKLMSAIIQPSRRIVA
ncbi:MAG: hypothetical protein WC789_07120 [Lentisphaeria bacterium]